MRVRVLHAKLYAYALPGSTARQLFISSTLLDSSTALQLLDRPRQTSTELDAQVHAAWSQARQARQELDSISTGSTGKASTAPRQYLDSASTESGQLDSSTARAQPPPRAPGVDPGGGPAVGLPFFGPASRPAATAALPAAGAPPAKFRGNIHFRGAARRHAYCRHAYLLGRLSCLAPRIIIFGTSGLLACFVFACSFRFFSLLFASRCRTCTKGQLSQTSCAPKHEHEW